MDAGFQVPHEGDRSGESRRLMHTSTAEANTVVAAAVHPRPGTYALLLSSETGGEECAPLTHHLRTAERRLCFLSDDLPLVDSFPNQHCIASG